MTLCLQLFSFIQVYLLQFHSIEIMHSKHVNQLPPLSCQALHYYYCEKMWPPKNEVKRNPGYPSLHEV